MSAEWLRSDDRRRQSYAPTHLVSRRCTAVALHQSGGGMRDAELQRTSTPGVVIQNGGVISASPHRYAWALWRTMLAGSPHRSPRRPDSTETPVVARRRTRGTAGWCSAAGNRSTTCVQARIAKIHRQIEEWIQRLLPDG